jgi:uncharacterized membrane protein HdeD (DUF308 family)
MGILGLILIIAGIYSLIAVSTVLGIALIVGGILVYVAFVITEKTAKSHLNPNFAPQAAFLKDILAVSLQNP